MYARAVKKCFLLEMENSAGIEEGQEIGHSAKGHPWQHGIGLMNVRDVVEKYHGTIEIEPKEGIFAISVLVPFQNHT